MRRIASTVISVAVVLSAAAVTLPSSMATAMTSAGGDEPTVKSQLLNGDEVLAAANSAAHISVRQARTCWWLPKFTGAPGLACDALWQAATPADGLIVYPWRTEIMHFSSSERAHSLWKNVIRDPEGSLGTRFYGLNGEFTIRIVSNRPSEITWVKDYAFGLYGRSTYTAHKVGHSIVVAQCTGTWSYSPARPISACSRAVARAQADRVSSGR